MPNTTNRPLRVFLCHSTNDKPAVRELNQKLRAEPWIQPWLDEEELYPGQDWNMEIEKAIEETDVILVCLSNNAITKEGYVQREIRIALDYADYKPEGTLFIIPVRLEECKPPKRLLRWQYADYFEGQRERGIQRLLVSLQRRTKSLGLKIEPTPVGRVSNPTPSSQPEQSQAQSPTYETHVPDTITLSNGMEFMCVPAGKFLMGSNNGSYDEKPQHTVDISYDYWMARYPVTNVLYYAYMKSEGIQDVLFDWLDEKDHPVDVWWKSAMAYCQWLNETFKSKFAESVGATHESPLLLRLPTEAEWEKAARGTDGREYPWGNQFDKNICNTNEGGKGGATPVGLYSPQGDSPYGCADMSGNVWEWTHSLKNPYPYIANDGREDENASGRRVIRGGSFINRMWNARCAYRDDNDIPRNSGFRVVASPAHF